jgi:hypothetical protein
LVLVHISCHLLGSAHKKYSCQCLSSVLDALSGREICPARVCDGQGASRVAVLVLSSCELRCCRRQQIQVAKAAKTTTFTHSSLPILAQKAHDSRQCYQLAKIYLQLSEAFQINFCKSVPHQGTKGQKLTRQPHLTVALGSNEGALLRKSPDGFYFDSKTSPFTSVA